MGLRYISVVMLCSVKLICDCLLYRRKMRSLFCPELVRNRQTAENPLKNLDDWDDFVASRYKENRDREDFRNDDPDVNPGVAEFYRQNHALQTVDFVQTKEHQYLPLQKEQKTIWQAAEFLNTLIDDSDPDTDQTQIDHLLQTSEAIRKDGHPRWFVLPGLIHDVGRSFVSMESHCGLWLAIHFPSVVPTRMRLSFPNISARIRILRIRCIRSCMASTNLTVD
jgi:Myo-inositol oxygenase